MYPIDLLMYEDHLKYPYIHSYMKLNTFSFYADKASQTVITQTNAEQVRDLCHILIVNLFIDRISFRKGVA